jgi:hypothetical protein
MCSPSLGEADVVADIDLTKQDARVELTATDRTVSISTRATSYGVRVDFTEEFDDTFTHSLVVVPPLHEVRNLATAGMVGDRQVLSRGVTPALGRAPLTPWHGLAVSGLASLGDPALHVARDAAILAGEKYLIRDGEPSVIVDPDTDVLYNTTAADAGTPAVCSTANTPAGPVSAHIGEATAKFTPPGGPEFSLSAWAIYNKASSTCPPNRAPIPDTQSSLSARFRTDWTPPAPAKPCDGLVYHIKGTAYSQIDNRQPDDDECKGDGKNDGVELISLEASADKIGKLTWASEKSWADLACDSVQCGSLRGEGWACMVFKKQGDAWSWLPEWNIGSNFTSHTSRNRTRCVMPLDPIPPTPTPTPTPTPPTTPTTPTTSPPPPGD